MEMDGTYDHNIEIPMNFIYGAKSESICNANKYNRNGPAVKINALNHFKDPLETCVVAGSLNRELISQLIFYSNKYTSGKVDHYKATNVAEIYQLIGILLKISLTSLDVGG